MTAHDLANNQVIIALEHFTEFGLFGQAEIPTSLDEIDELMIELSPEIYLPMIP